MKFLIFKKYCKVISSIQILKCNIANFILICQHFSFPLAIILHILVWHRFKNRGDLKIGKGLKMQIRSSVRKIINYIPHIFEIPNIDLCFRAYTEKCCILRFWNSVYSTPPNAKSAVQGSKYKTNFNYLFCCMWCSGNIYECQFFWKNNIPNIKIEGPNNVFVEKANSKIIMTEILGLYFEPWCNP